MQSIWSDDGIALHLPDADAPPPVADLLIGPDEIEELVVQEVGQTALFGARFRENASRALLIPRRRPGQRTPLWQQRLKAQSLLQVARKYGSFPIVLETYRECLQDVFDLPALRRILHGLQTRELDLVEVETASASPFASSLLFDYVATYMYEDDTPPAERRAQALSLDRDLLRELLGQEELRELLDRDAIEEVERSLQPAPRERRRAARPVARARATGSPATTTRASPRRCSRERRAIRFRLAGQDALVAAEDAGRYRDALGVMPPGGLPDAFLEGGTESLPQLVLRFARGRGPFTTAEAEAHFGFELEPLLHELERSDAARARRAAAGRERARVVRPGGAAPAAPRLARGAAEGGRAGGAGRARALPAGVARDRPAGEPARGARAAAGAAAAGVAVGVRGAAAPRAQLPAGLAGRLCASGELVWVGAGLDRVAVYFREDAPAARPAGGRAGARGRGGRRDSRARSSASAEFWYPLVEAAGLEPEGALPALWELVWAGEVTNDAWTPLARRPSVRHAK